MSSKQRIRFAAFAIVVALLGVSCGDDGQSGDAGTGPSTTAAATATTSAPVKGGTLTVGTYLETISLDPIVTTGAGVNHGMELIAIYDLLVRFNPTTGKYEPRLAESWTNNADFTEWTLKLRPGVKFADGSPYNAAAVKFNFERQKTLNASGRGSYAVMKEITAVDDVTVKVVLSESFPGYIDMLTKSLGMIASPTAIGAGGDKFATNPVNAGAGPFQFSSFKAKEAVILKRNPTYWDGDVYLDELKFVFLGGAQATLDAIKTGSIDAGFLREAAVIDRAKKDGLQGFSIVETIGEMILINAGVEVTCTGGKPEPACVGQADNTKVATKSPGTNKTVRQAIQAAIDAKVIDQRANEGKGIPGTSVFAPTFPWDPKVAAPQPDPAKAKQLVAQAKSEGWDGKIRLSCNNTPQRQGTALAVQAMLNAVGIDVDMSRASQDVNQVIGDVITNKNYDLACWGMAVTPDDGGWIQLDSMFRSTSTSNRTGYKSAAMDSALLEGKRASTDAAKTAAYKKIADLIVADAATVVAGHQEEFVAWSPKVQGPLPHAAAIVDFSKAFKAR